MKTLRILTTLTTTETKKFEERIKSQKRENVRTLYRELKKLLKSKKEVDRAALFAAVFNRKYTKSSDYLLRDAIRHLNDLLYNQLIDWEYEAQMKERKQFKQRFLADSLDRRDLFKDYMDELRKGIDMTVKAHNFYAGSWFQFDYAQAFITAYNLDENPTVVDEIFEEIEKSKELLKVDFLMRLKKMEEFEVYIQRFQVAQDHTIYTRSQNRLKTERHGNIIDFSAMYDKYTLLRYYELSIQARSENYDESIPAHISMLEIMDEVIPEKYLLGEKATIHTNVGVRYAQLGQHQEGAKHFSKAFAIDIQRGTLIKASPTLMSLARSQVHLGRSAETLQLYEEYATIIENYPDYPEHVNLIAFVHLFNQDSTKAFSYLPSGMKDKFFDQILCVLIALHDKEYELAEREILNLEKTLQRKKLAKDHFKYKLARMVKLYTQQWLLLDNAREKKLAELLEEVKAFGVTHTTEANTELVYLWLKLRLLQEGHLAKEEEKSLAGN